MRHDAVQEAAVVGKIGDDGLTRTLAYVVLKSGQDGDAALAQALQAFVKDQLAPLQISARDPVPCGIAQDRHRQDPAVQAARRRGGRMTRKGHSDVTVEPGTPAVAFVDLVIGGRSQRLEYAWIGAARDGAPVIVFLHEGLGSLAMWQDFPQALCAAAGARGLVFSRYGYGRSTPRPAAEKWPVEFMHVQAEDVLPALLRAVWASMTRLAVRTQRWRLDRAAAMPPRIRTASPAWWRSRRMFSSRTSAWPASNRRASPTRQRTCGSDSRATTTIRIPRFTAGTTSGSTLPFARWNIEDCLPRIRCSAAGRAGRGRRVRNDGADRRDRASRAAQPRLLKFPHADIRRTATSPRH